MSVTGGSSFGCGGRSFFDAKASATRRAAGGGAFRLLVFLCVEQCHGGSLFGRRRVAPEQGEGLVEDVLVLVPMDHRAAQRGAGLGLGGQVYTGQGFLRGDSLGWAYGQSGATQQTREMHDVAAEAGRVRARAGRMKRV